MDQEALKRLAAEAALSYVPSGRVIGIGAGSTVEHFVRALARSGVQPRGVIPASDRTCTLLGAHRMTRVPLDESAIPLALHVDGADEVDSRLCLIKGKGGAHAREKVLASAAELFVCIVDESKLVESLGKAPVPVEVIPPAIHFVARELQRLGGRPVLRKGFETDNGNLVLDVYDLDLEHPEVVESTLCLLPGVLECGIFARRRPDVLIIGTQSGVRRLEREVCS